VGVAFSLHCGSETGSTVKGITPDLSQSDAALLIAFTATKETDYGAETDG